MARVRINDRGIADLKRRLGKGMLNVGFAIENVAKDIVPVRTGNLRRSIHTVAFADGEVVGTSGEVPQGYDTDGIGCIVGTNTGYGIYVELGTVKMSPRPYLTPALDIIRPRIVALLKAGMG
jgi:HK97 gp10 family phage protein